MAFQLNRETEMCTQEGKDTKHPHPHPDVVHTAEQEVCRQYCTFNDDHHGLTELTLDEHRTPEDCPHKV